MGRRRLELREIKSHFFDAGLMLSPVVLAHKARRAAINRLRVYIYIYTPEIFLQRRVIGAPCAFAAHIFFSPTRDENFARATRLCEYVTVALAASFIGNLSKGTAAPAELVSSSSSSSSLAALFFRRYARSYLFQFRRFIVDEASNCIYASKCARARV